MSLRHERPSGLRVQAKRVVLRCGTAILLITLAAPAAAQSASSLQVGELRSQLEALKAEQAQTNAHIRTIENAIDRMEGRPPSPEATVTNATAPAWISATPASAAASAPSKLQLSGDFRLRYESNLGDEDARDRNRGVLRARLRGSYAALDWLTLGAQIATGDADDPNSTDITLSNFDDDLDVSLDQAYARATIGNLQLTGGKIPQSFTRTELVWDGDVSPQGLAASYNFPLAGGGIKATGLYFLVDESVAGPDSSMAGVQIGLDSAPAATWRYELAAAYYDYSLRSIAGADGGDFRSNLRRPDGRYLSDFNLVDAIATLTYQGLGARWPIRLVGDYVKNLGAATDADTGYGMDLLVGRLSKAHDWRIGYGYAAAETDAVLAAFSHDNTSIATNYLQHALTVDYALRSNLLLNATFYHYRPYHALDAGENTPTDWLDRIRLNFLVAF